MKNLICVLTLMFALPATAQVVSIDLGKTNPELAKQILQESQKNAPGPTTPEDMQLTPQVCIAIDVRG